MGGSCICNLPGCERQNTHSDTHHAEMDNVNYALQYSLLVSLQDTTYDMGPTLLYPGTHTANFHREHQVLAKQLGTPEKATQQALFETQGVHASVRRGDAVI